jgi:hypothetical protein
MSYHKLTPDRICRLAWTFFVLLWLTPRIEPRNRWTVTTRCGAQGDQQETPRCRKRRAKHEEHRTETTSLLVDLPGFMPEEVDAAMSPIRRLEGAAVPVLGSSWGGGSS